MLGAILLYVNLALWSPKITSRRDTLAFKPANFDIVLQRGCYGSVAAIVFSFVDCNDKIIPLLGCKVALVARGPNFKMVKSTDSGDVIIDVIANTATWTPKATDVYAAMPVPASYFVEIVFPDGSAQRCIEGKFSIVGLVV